MVSNRRKRSLGCPGVVHETWRADEVILERKKSSQSRDCHDLSHTYARVKALTNEKRYED